MTQDRRDFLAKIGLGAVALSGSAIVAPLGAEELDRLGEAFVAEPSWNMSWVDELQKVPYKAVFDSPSLADGAALDLAADIWGAFKDIYGTDSSSHGDRHATARPGHGVQRHDVGEVRDRRGAEGQ